MTSPQMQPSDRGWYPDPFDMGKKLRLFDGAKWTDRTRPIPEGGFNPPQPEQEQANEPKSLDPKPAPEPQDASQTMPMFSKPVTSAPMQEKPAAAGGFAPPTERSADSPSTTPPAAQGFQTPTTKAMGAEEAGDTTEWSSGSFQERVDSDSLDQERLKPAFTKPTAQAASSTKPTQAAGDGGWSTPQAPVEDSEAPGWGTPTSRVDEEDDGIDDPGDVKAAFAAAAPLTSDTQYDSASADFDDSKLGRLKAMLNGTVVTWVVVLLVGIALVVGPVLTPSPIQTLPADCTPLTDVLDAYQDTDNVKVTKEAQQKIAAVIAEGKISDDMVSMLKTAVDKNNLEPVLSFCTPS